MVEQSSNFDRVMEARNLFENGAVSKNQTSRRNLLKAASTVIAIFFAFACFAQGDKPTTFYSQLNSSKDRVPKVTEKIIVTSEADWKKVVFTNRASEVEGLTRVEEKEMPSGGWSVFDKLAKDAAAKGCHVVLFLADHSNGETRAKITGVVFYMY